MGIASLTEEMCGKSQSVIYSGLFRYKQIKGSYYYLISIKIYTGSDFTSYKVLRKCTKKILKSQKYELADK
jgi:hypothetical protein